MIGIIGKLLILVALVATALSGFAYLRSSEVDFRVGNWKKIGRAGWLLMFVTTVASFGLLMYLSLTHQFQYAYVYENTSLNLALKFLISATWAGQEGSFLLWIVLNGIVGLSVIRFARDYEGPVMAIIALCQFFLVSLILGLHIGEFTIGASPFATLAEAFPNAPMIQAGIVPADGQGLNDLLQNYWMVIHPPILFSGFSSMIVPFAFALTALWKRKYTHWVRPALPWMIVGLLLLGVGIMLGGYWAYETLSFGGYWAWDPVENSSLVPWIFGVAALHTMIVQKRSGHSQKAAVFLTIAAYLLVVYSTFLTRSGILGDISVHSFVDLGLYNQLLLWILTFVVLGLGLFALRYKELPQPEHEPELLSREFLIFAGAMIFTAAGLVVLLGTSAPIIGRLFRDNPSSVPIMFYNKWTLPLMVATVFLAGLGQLFWWSKMSVDNINKVLVKPIILSVISTILIILFTPFTERARALSLAVEEIAEPLRQAGFIGNMGTFWNTHGIGILLLLLTFVSLFAFFGNGSVLLRIAKGNIRMAGGALAHIGFAVMVLGVISSSGFSNPVVKGTGVRIGENRDNFVVALGETRTISEYSVKYTGHGLSDENRPTYILDITDPSGREFTAEPVVYKSDRGQWIQHPDVKTFIEKDLFVAVTPNLMFQNSGAARSGEITLARGDSTILGENRFRLTFLDFDTSVEDQFLTDSTEIAVAANILITNLETGETRESRPVYLIQKDRSVSYVQNKMKDWGLTVTFTGMNVDNGSINLGIEGVQMEPEDWLVVQAYEKPMISLVWLGFMILCLGFIAAIGRRSADQRLALKRALRT